MSSTNVNEDNEIPQEIFDLSKDPLLYRRIVGSIAPSIYGCERVKEGIMYWLFGGVERVVGDVKKRGAINVLLVGEPSTAKTSLLASAATIAGAVLLDGRVTYSRLVREEGKNTYFCIDGLERSAYMKALNDFLHSLNYTNQKFLVSTCPKFGKWNPDLIPSENLDVFPSLLAYFDLIFVMRDVANKQSDDLLSEFVLQAHSRSETKENIIPINILRSYIAYARKINPILTSAARKKLGEYFVAVRAADYGIPITPRHLEGLIYLAEAHARIALRKEVTEEDAQAAVKIFNESMQQVCFDTATGKMDRDILDTGAAKSTPEKLKIAYAVVLELVKETGYIKTEVVYQELEKKGIHRDEAESLIGMLYRDNKIYEPRPKYLKRV